MRDKQAIVVETEFGPWRGTRMVDPKPVPLPEPLRLGDPWCPLTVRARLQRVNWVLTRHPKVKPATERSCMPETVREKWKDAAKGTVVRLRPPKRDETAVNQTLLSLVAYQDEIDRHVVWAIATKMPDTELAAYIGVSDKTARARKQEMLKLLAADWNARGWLPEREDLDRAQRFIHRNRK